MIVCHKCGRETPNDGTAFDKGWRYSFLHRELTRCLECRDDYMEPCPACNTLIGNIRKPDK